MADQKLLIALVRVKDKAGKENTIPVGFKLDSNKIPSQLKAGLMHPDNLIKITIDGFRPISSMIVSVGDDSEDLMASFKLFCDYVKHLKLPGLTARIQHFLALENILIESVKASGLKVTSKGDFDSFLQRADYLERKEKDEKRFIKPRPVPILKQLIYR
ncbi:uncharacterized protein LOC128391841 [Panonychus citri]|uniref:uncharacterized protein LOC128391841 n=1 Tax=Panonychus citri TaxID=50023 RepID=UPI00230833BC|nr:uncharacterized protein LOC128391841 [Panonychus citri]